MNFRGELPDEFATFSPVGKLARQKTEVPLNQMVAEIIKEFATETIQWNIVWYIRTLPMVQADQGMLQMVMGDLIANAVKLAKLRAKTIIEVGWLPDVKNETVIFIQDNAAGFDAQFAGKLFNVFKRRPGQPGFEDEGIGPANIQREIQRHGGRSWATGMVDKGSTFYFSIPADENRSGFAMKA